MNRRQFLSTVGVTGVVTVAGCAGGGKEESGGSVPGGYTRYVDCEAGTVIYEQNRGEGGFEVIPIEETDLASECE